MGHVFENRAKRGCMGGKGGENDEIIISKIKINLIFS